MGNFSDLSGEYDILDFSLLWEKNSHQLGSKISPHVSGFLFSLFCCFLLLCLLKLLTLLCPKHFILLTLDSLSRQTHLNSRDSITTNVSITSKYFSLPRCLCLEPAYSTNFWTFHLHVFLISPSLNVQNWSFNHPFKPSLLAHLREWPQIHSAQWARMNPYLPIFLSPSNHSIHSSPDPVSTHPILPPHFSAPGLQHTSSGPPQHPLNHCIPLQSTHHTAAGQSSPANLTTSYPTSCPPVDSQRLLWWRTKH